MAKKKKTLPKNFEELIRAKDIPALKAVFVDCELNARGGNGKVTALSFFQAPDELLRWLVEQGADVNARDHYKRTPLHHQAAFWCGNVDLLLDLGADIEALDYQDETPLHSAAGSFQAHAADALVSRGANIHAESKMGYTPLAKALSRCRNIDIPKMAEVAGILLAAGAKVRPEMLEDAARIGKEFEFHRESFAPEFMRETEAGLTRLYELFGLAPVPRRRTHDGVSPIRIAEAPWNVMHDEFWQLLVPAQGSAKTVQGEVIRLSGRLAREVLDNGGANWDADFRKMLAALVRHLGSGTPLAPEELAEAAARAKQLEGGAGDKEPERLMELSVRWVRANPDPAPLGRPDYRR